MAGRRVRVLALLVSLDGVTIQEIADALEVKPSRVAEDVDGLSRLWPIWEEDCPVGCGEAPCLHSLLRLAPAPGGKNG